MRIDEAKRKFWLRSLRRFKYGIKVRAKLGVLQTICEQVAAERNGRKTWDAPDWSHLRWVTLLYTCIKENQFPPELLIAFAKTAEVTFLNPNKQPTAGGVVVAVNEVCRGQSKALRQMFGVFV
jgi:hypothetical protein